VRTFADQLDSGGTSPESIARAALDLAHPEPGLRWLDIGCGEGQLLRLIKERWQPSELHGLDPIAWLAEDLRGEVSFQHEPAEQARLPQADRVMLIETIEHLQAPWSTLRNAARAVAPGGWIVVSTPSLATLRTRLELLVRGNLTSFRPGYEPHLSPALPHVTARLLGEEGLDVKPPSYAEADVIPLTGGRTWPERVRSRFPELTSVSVIVAASRPD